MRVARAALARTTASLALLAALSPAPVLAAEVTDITPFLHFKGGMGYRGQFIQGQYVRDGQRVGAREEERQFVDFDARFGAWYGLELYLRFSHDNWDRVRWQELAFDNGVPPAGGAFQDERRKGIADVVVGGKFAILSEARKTGDVSTWTVETNFKIPGSFEIYPSTDPAEPEAPAGTPGLESYFGTSFSKRIRFFDPYVTFFYLHRGSASSPDEDVSSFNLADQWGTFFGTEVVGFERPADNLRFSGDFGLGWRYIMEGEVPANRFLYGPDSGATNRPGGYVVTEQGYIRYDMRIGFYYQLQQHVQARGHLTYGLPTEHFIESYSAGFLSTSPGDSRSGSKVRNKEFTDFGYNFTMHVFF